MLVDSLHAVPVARIELPNFISNKELKVLKSLERHYHKDKVNISKDIFIDNPRDNSAEHFLKLNKETQSGDLEKFKTKLYHEKTKVINEVETKIQNLTIEKRNLDIKIHGKVDDYLKLELESPFKLLKLKSKSKLKKSTKDILNQATLIKRFKNLETSEFHINKFETQNLTKKLFIPLKELDLIKKEIVFQLNGQKYIPAIELPKLKLNKFQPKKAKLSILISSKEDLNLLSKINDLDIFFKIPDNLEDKYEDYIKLFKENKNLIPWFPTIIIGKDYDLAVNFLHNINPSLIITNNTGIAYEAYKAKIPWIAGPYINVVNSYSLISLKENFNCKGSFISNELNRLEIKQIKNYKNLDLYYSIYHPILLMTTRMCLFHQVTGCEKNIMNNTCIKNCEKSSTITNLNGTKYFIEKTLGDNHRIFNSKNFLNLDIIEDLPNIFSNFLIDLTNIQTDTNSKIDKYSLIKLFQNSINSDIESINIIKKALSKTTNQQYKKGL